MQNDTEPVTADEVEVTCRLEAIASLAGNALSGDFPAGIVLDAIEGLCQKARPFLPPEAA